MKEIIIGYNEHKPGEPDPLWTAWQQTGEIVRCKDCKHFSQDQCQEMYGLCFKEYDRIHDIPVRYVNWFCADGEKKVC